MRTLFPTLAALALALPATAHETGVPAHIHPHGSETLIVGALVAAVAVVALRLVRR